MSIFGDEIVQILNGDPQLESILTGGAVAYPATGRKGLNRIITNGAYDPSTGLLKPFALVLELTDTIDDQIVGESTSSATPIAIWIYDKGDSESQYTAIDAAFKRIYSLLHLSQIADACQILYKGVVKNKRETDLNDAAYYRVMFNVYSYLTIEQ